MKTYTLAVVGATGMVGRKMIEVLEERCFPVEKIYFFASSRSAGKALNFNGKSILVEALDEHSFDRGIDIALFSAGGDISKKFAPIAAQKGCVVIDNSSAWRMDKNVPLIVPEINAEQIKKHRGIIANPNCSTIQSVLPLKPLYDSYGIERVIYSTYQAVSGAGYKGVDDLSNGLNGVPAQKFDHQIAGNVIPHIDILLEDGYYKEEVKMIEETKKILGDNCLGVTATAVRVPVVNGHCVSINVTLTKEFDIADVKNTLSQYSGIFLLDNPEKNQYPMPLDVTGKDAVYVGRVRRDFSAPRSLNLWCVADNIRKGAATNAVQIAEQLIKVE